MSFMGKWNLNINIGQKKIIKTLLFHVFLYLPKLILLRAQR